MRSHIDNRNHLNKEITPLNVQFGVFFVVVAFHPLSILQKKPPTTFELLLCLGRKNTQGRF